MEKRLTPQMEQELRTAIVTPAEPLIETSAKALAKRKLLRWTGSQWTYTDLGYATAKKLNLV